MKQTTINMSQNMIQQCQYFSDSCSSRFPKFTDIIYCFSPYQLRSSVAWGLLRWDSSKESVCNAGDTRDTGSIPESGRSPGAENGNPLQYSCLKNSMDKGAWWASPWGSQSDTTEQLRTHYLSKCFYPLTKFIPLQAC